MLRNFLSTDPIDQLQNNDDALAILRFGNAAQSSAPTIHVAELPGHNATELWKSAQGPVESGVDGACHWRRDRFFQFTTVNLPLGPQDDYDLVAETAYKELLTTISKSPAPNLVRFWNYVPAINDGKGDSENYKRFCNGRLAAFNKHNIESHLFPAASAVGHHQNGLAVCALSSVHAATHHANPRQVDAFKYPRQYGPSSPSFARASTISAGDNDYCFISGTASILGHRTVHEGDLALQLHTTNDNIFYLLEETGFKAQQIQTLRVYLRDANQVDLCRELVHQSYPDCELVLAEADICRQELLVEIEAFCVSSNA